MPKFKQNNSLNLTWENIKWHVSLNPVLKEKKKRGFFNCWWGFVTCLFLVKVGNMKSVLPTINSSRSVEGW